MRKSLLALALSSLIVPACAADYAPSIPPSLPLAHVPPAPRIATIENVRPLIDLGLFWNEVRKSQSVEEVQVRLDARFRGVPVVFQGINELNQFQRVSILRAYRRVEDEKVDLPAVTFDTITDGVPRTITVPLWPMGVPFTR